MRTLRFWIRQTFGFRQGEVNGFLILCILIILLLLAPLFYPLFFPPVSFDHSADQIALDSLAALLEKKDSVKDSHHGPAAESAPKASVLFDFDPNQISTEQWQTLGLPKYLAERILKYRSKGGKFRIKGDLKKIYGFPEPLYQQLHGYILLPDSLTFTAYKNNRKHFEEKPKLTGFPEKKTLVLARFDINAADTVQLASVRGIGPALSRRIIKYRDLLGGFAGNHQLYEVYGLDSTVVEELLKRGYLTPGNGFQKLRINTATEKELDAHPYISPRLAKVIVAYRAARQFYLRGFTGRYQGSR